MTLTMPERVARLEELFRLLLVRIVVPVRDEAYSRQSPPGAEEREAAYQEALALLNLGDPRPPP